MFDRMRCDGKHTLPLQNREVKDRLFPPVLCENCNESAQQIILTNDGDILLIDLVYDNTKHIPTLHDGPLKDNGTYRFQQIYFNWIETTREEEWDFNDVNFPAELHIVFYNTKYASYAQAFEKDEAVVILSMRFRVGP